MKRLRPTRTGLLALIVAVLVPAAALAGKTVISGEQQLNIHVTLDPARAGARGVTLHFHSLLVNPKHPGQQPPYNGNETIIRYPKGMSANGSAVPKCLESTVIKAKDAAKACPAASKVGAGTVVVNGRPAIKNLITGTLAAYNGDDDKGYGGYPKGSRMLIIIVKTSIGLTVPEFLHATKAPDGSPESVGKSNKPSKPGIAPGDITLQKLDLTIGGPHSAYLMDPPTCGGSWTFSLTSTNYFGQPSITATDTVKCNS